MPVQVDWVDDAKSILRIELLGYWTWKEIFECADVTYALCDSQKHSVNLILDMRNSAGLPLRSLTHISSVIAKRHPRGGLTAFMGANQLFVALWKTFSSTYKQASHSDEFAFARDDAEAFELFAASRNTPNSINKAALS